MDNKIKFGIIIPQGWFIDLPSELPPIEQFELIKKYAIEAEEIGYDSIWLFDHFHTVPKIEYKSVFECWTTLTALAMCTRKVGLGQIVTCNYYRQPTILAKMASILDVISKGRLEFGIGAGWYEHEFYGYGFDFPKPSIRIGMLEEAVQIIKLMWIQDKVDFNGKYYKIKNGINFPKPIQKPHPPILIGGRGEKLTLKVIAKYANRFNVPHASLEEYKRKLSILKEHCLNIGRNFNEIEKTLRADIIIGLDEKEVKGIKERIIKDGRNKKYISGEKWEDIPEEEYFNSRIVGTPEECIEKIKEYIKLGVSYFILYFPYMIENDSHILFAKEVIPKFK
ncbi:MAG: TIGR03560 family F420-dependent LLM class oxidoreductase [Nitrososphaerota archaeon]